MEHRLGPTPVWLFTAGTGMPWVHVRLDHTPSLERALAVNVFNPDFSLTALLCLDISAISASFH
jgi:hypothetical protein